MEGEKLAQIISGHRASSSDDNCRDGGEAHGDLCGSVSGSWCRLTAEDAEDQVVIRSAFILPLTVLPRRDADSSSRASNEGWGAKSAMYSTEYRPVQSSVHLAALSWTRPKRDEIGGGHKFVWRVCLEGEDNAC